MKNNESNSNQRLQPDRNEVSYEPEGYPFYPENEDIYTKFKKEKRVDPEDITLIKDTKIVGIRKEDVFNDDSTGSVLDITESEDVSEYIKIDESEIFYTDLGGDDSHDSVDNPDL